MRNITGRINTAQLSRSWLTQKGGGSGEAQFFSRVERVTPVRPPSLEADVLVPGAQCLIVGLGAFMVATVMGGAWLPLEQAAVLGVAVGGIGAGAMAYDAIREARRSLYSVETLKDNLAATQNTGAEIVAETSTVELRVVRADMNEERPPIFIRQLPVDEERLREFAQAALRGVSMSQTEWVGSDKLFSRTEFDETLKLLMELGIIAWNSSRDNAQGRSLTRGGRHALQAWLDGRMMLSG